SDLLVVAQHDRILADKIDAANMAVEINPDARPVQPRRDLFDMRGFAGAVIAANHHAPVEGEAGENCERGVVVKSVGIIEIGDVLARLAARRNLKIAVDPEGLADRDRNVGLFQWERAGGRRW